MALQLNRAYEHQTLGGSTLNKLCSLSINQVLTVKRYSVATFHQLFLRWNWTRRSQLFILQLMWLWLGVVMDLGLTENKLYLCRSSRRDTLSFHAYHSPLLQTQTHTNTRSFCLHLSSSECGTLHWGFHVENHSAFHSNQTRLLSNYFWSQPSWPGQCLSVLAWEFIRQNSDSWEGRYFFFMWLFAIASIYASPKTPHDGWVLILINT